MEIYSGCQEFILPPSSSSREIHPNYLLLPSSFKVKKRYRGTAIVKRSCHSSPPSSSLNILRITPLFLIFVVISSLPLNHNNYLNLRSSLLVAGASNSPDTRQISLPASSTTTSLIASSLSTHQATNTSSSSSSSISNSSNQTTATATAAATATATATSNSSPTSISPSERLLNLVKTNFANSNQTTNGRFIHSKVLRPVASYGQQQHQQFETAYACEGNRLDLSCREEGKLIHVVRANYGRFSLSICNELGHSNLSTDCASFRAFLPMQSRCNKQSNCSVNVSKELFGDPCENTPKYLEVQYYCKDANNNVNNNQPGASGSQTITTATNNGNNFLNSKTNQPLDSSVLAAPPLRTSTGHKSQSFAASDSIATIASGPASSSSGGGGGAEDFGSDFTNSNKHETTVMQQVNLDQYCPPQSSSRNLYWNYTRAGSAARQACPEGSSGKTSWYCDPERLRFTPLWSPDFTQCKSTWLARLANQLDHMLEMPSKQQLSTDALKQQNEQILKVVLNDLALMARTKELFSEDLKRIDIMISQIITQIRSLSALYGSANFNSWRSPPSSAANFNIGGGITPSGNGLNSFNIMYEDLFNKLVNIVSSLFDTSQRSAWLDMQPNEYRKKLEQRFLNHLKDAGILLATSANQLSPTMEFRQANVFASLTVINNGLSAATSSRFSPLNTNLMDSLVGNDFNLQQLSKLSNKFTTLEDNNQQQMDNQLSEFKINASILRELVTNGITKVLVLDVKKPDYSIIKQHFESTYASAASSQIDGNLLDNNLIGEQQWTSRVSGLFVIVGETGDVLDGQQQANLQLQNKLTDLLAQWPISVDFKLSPSGTTSTSTPAVIPPTTTQQNSQPLRQCNSLNSDNVNQQNRCQTFTSNVTNHICRCDQFGFVALTTSASNQQVPTSILGDFHWPTMFGTGASQQQQQPIDNEPRSPIDFPPDLTSVGSNSMKNVDFIDSAPSLIRNNKQQASLGVWSTIFVVLGISLLVVSFVAFFINFILKSSSQTRLSKKQAGFSASILHRVTGGGGTSNDLNGLSTTGPIADHSLIGSIDPIVNHSPSQVGITNASNSTTASMMAGLSQSAYHHNYKAHQQLYTSHLPPIEVCSNPIKRWTRWAAWLKPSNWPPFSSSVGKGVDQIIEHRVIGSTIGPGSVSYKSQYQNGYTTALHHSHQSTANSQVPLAAPSSSTSSYVSSSAYYEEIGPGNLTKINTNQLTSRNTHTIVDPFKRQIQAPTADQQQALTSNQQSQHVHHQPWQSSGPTTAPVGSTTALSYPPDSQQHQQQPYLNYGQPLSAIFKQQQQNNNNNNNNNDLNQVQSSSSSAASQHSTSTSLTTANGSTPRHYLFASPSAANAYKSSMSQQTLHNQHHHQQQHNHLQQQHQPFTTTSQYQHQFKQDQHQHQNNHNHQYHPHNHGRQFMQN